MNDTNCSLPKYPNMIPAAAANSLCPGTAVTFHCQPNAIGTALVSGAKARLNCLNTGSQSPPLPSEACWGMIKGSPFLSSLQVGMPKH